MKTATKSPKPGPKRKQTATITKATTTESKTKKSTDKLVYLLANSYALLIKIHNYHWNARGASFYSFHKLTEAKYTELFQAIDEIAEKTRTLEVKVPASISYFHKISDLSEPNNALSIDKMVEDLVQSNKKIIKDIYQIIPLFEEAKNQSIVDFLVHRIAWHEETSWLFKSQM